MTEQEKFDTTIRILASLNDAPPPNPLRQASARRAFLEHAARLRSEREQRKGGFFPRSFRLAAGGLGACVLALGMLTGVVYAADGARPGDLLYPIDRGTEDLRLRLNQDPDAAVHLLLSFAEERLRESEQLASEGDEANMAVALEAHGQALSDLAQTIGGPGADQEALAALIDAILTNHEQRLLAVRALVSEHAYPGLDRAIEAVRQVRQNVQPKHAPEDSGLPEDERGNGKPESTPGPTNDEQNEDSEEEDGEADEPDGPLGGNPGNGLPYSATGQQEGNPASPPEGDPGNGPPDPALGDHGGNPEGPQESNSSQGQPSSVPDPQEDKPGGPPD